MLNEANVDIKVLPLLNGNIEIGKITLDGLKLSFSTNAQGQNNWDDLAQANASTTPSAASTSTTSNSKFKLDSLKISDVDISNAAISYNNLKTNQKYELREF